VIRVLVVDDQALVREGIRAILGPASGVEIVGEAGDGEEALVQAARLAPDVVLMDLKMPRMNGVQATRALRQQQPELRVLALTTYDADEWVFDAIRAGAAGYLLKDPPGEDLVQAIRETAAGQTSVAPAVAGKLFAQVAQRPAPPAPALLAGLSPRDLEVLALIARGFSNAAIAQQLSLSEGTVRNYVSRILAHLGVADRTQAAILALQYNL
jgi:DNA-binding NarL/FixJ family response regulator